MIEEEIYKIIKREGKATMKMIEIELVKEGKYYSYAYISRKIKKLIGEGRIRKIVKGVYEVIE